MRVAKTITFLLRCSSDDLCAGIRLPVDTPADMRLPTGEPLDDGCPLIPSAEGRSSTKNRAACASVTTLTTASIQTNALYRRVGARAEVVFKGHGNERPKPATIHLRRNRQPSGSVHINFQKGLAIDRQCVYSCHQCKLHTL